MELVKAGANRQSMHELIRDHSMQAWESIRAGGENPLADTLSADSHVTAYLAPDRVRSLLNVEDYVGDAPYRARQVARNLIDLINS
jgi:adenylosuccinate lyase